MRPRCAACGVAPPHEPVIGTCLCQEAYYCSTCTDVERDQNSGRCYVYCMLCQHAIAFKQAFFKFFLELAVFVPPCEFTVDTISKLLPKHRFNVKLHEKARQREIDEFFAYISQSIPGLTRQSHSWTANTLVSALVDQYLAPLGINPAYSFGAALRMARMFVDESRFATMNSDVVRLIVTRRVCELTGFTETLHNMSRSVVVFFNCCAFSYAHSEFSVCLLRAIAASPYGEDGIVKYKTHGRLTPDFFHKFLHGTELCVQYAWALAYLNKMRKHYTDFETLFCTQFQDVFVSVMLAMRRRDFTVQRAREYVQRAHADVCAQFTVRTIETQLARFIKQFAHCDEWATQAERTAIIACARGAPKEALEGEHSVFNKSMTKQIRQTVMRYVIIKTKLCGALDASVPVDICIK
jgi:hypothetical protein